MPSLLRERRARSFCICLLLITLTLLVFGRVTSFDFVSWDDDINFIHNPRLNPVTAKAWEENFTGRFYDTYRPVGGAVIMATAMAAYSSTPQKVAGLASGTHLNPAAFHGVNLLLHTATVLVVFFLLRLLLHTNREEDGHGIRDWAAGAGALLFAVHPVQVEAVAWATGITDILKGLFGFGALFLYLLSARAEHVPRARLLYVGATILLVAGLLSHPAVTIIPLLALLLDRGSLRRPWRQSLAPIGFWLFLAVLPLWLAVGSEGLKAADAGTLPAPPLHLRPLVWADSLLFYLRQLVWPAQLLHNYGRTPQWVLENVPALWLLLATGALGLAFFKLARGRALALSALLFFIVATLPNSGLQPFRFQAHSSVADRYLYLPLFGVALCFALLLRSYGTRWWPAFALFLLLLGGRAHQQAEVWQDNFTLFGHALRARPEGFTEMHNMAVALCEEGQFAAGEALLTQAIALHPGKPLSRLNLAELYGRQEKWPQALALYTALLRDFPRDPMRARTLNGYAFVCAATGKDARAIDAWEKCLQLEPGDAQVRLRLARVYQRNGQNVRATTVLQGRPAP